jgi:outer membrane lipoprotein-sorting protein
MLLLAGCASAPPAARPSAPEALAALNLVEQRWADFKDLRSLAEIEIRRDERVQRMAGVLLLRSPSSLRFEALAPFGTPVVIIAADADVLTIWEVPAERAFRLPASPDANRRWLGLAMGGDELVAILSGRVIPLQNPVAVELLAPDEIGPALFLRTADRTQRIWLDPATGEAKAAEWTGGANPARVVFTNRSDGIPQKVALGTLDGKLAVTVAYRNPAVNTAFDPELLRLSVPEHIRIQEFR